MFNKGFRTSSEGLLEILPAFLFELAADIVKQDDALLNRQQEFF
jgi:hypothetical protein